MAERERTIVVGAGLAGLYAACRLARRGIPTTVLEKRPVIGGYCSSIERDGYRFDIGATMLHAPQVLCDCFQSLDQDLHEHLELVELDPLYEVKFPDGASIAFHRDIQATAESIGRLSPRDASNFLRYASDLEKLKTLLKSLFIEHRYRDAPRQIGWSSIGVLRRISPWRSVEQLMGSYFHSEAIRAALSFQVYYLGAPPSACPAVYGMIPYFEVTKGVWYVRGGLSRITEALARIFTESGGRIDLGREVDQILLSGSRVRGVRTMDGDVIEAANVISNAEAAYTLGDLLPRGSLRSLTRRRVARCRPSCAPHLTLMGVDAQAIDLQSHHTFFMPKDMTAVARNLFELQRMPPEFCCYACYPSLSDSTLAPAGRGSLYVLTPAPQAGSAEWSSKRELLSRYADGLARRGVGGLNRDVHPHIVLDPPYYADEFNQPSGMGFGVRPSAGQLGPLRLGPRVAGIRGLYLTGASTNPGGGIPLVLSSGSSAAAAVIADVERRGRSRVLSMCSAGEQRHQRLARQ
jgi:phytoene desaturase